MWKSLLFGALLSCTFGLVGTPIHAPTATAVEKSGYNLFLSVSDCLAPDSTGDIVASVL